MNAPFDHAESDSSEIPADLRLLGIGLNQCERALLDYWPVVLHKDTYSKLFPLGIYGDGMNGRGAFDALHVGDVIFRQGGRFEFSRDVREVHGHVAGVIIPAREKCGDIVDLAAWNVDDGELALWRGVASMLGEDWINAPHVESDALAVFPDVASWLRAGRRGVVIIDSRRARWRLTGENLAVDDPAFGRRVRDALRLPEPQIFIASKGARRAA
jgi:hypothetical protein